jgi:hypothetical protein
MRTVVLIFIQIVGFVVLAAVINQLAKETARTVARRTTAGVAEPIRAVDQYVASSLGDGVRISLWHPEHGHLATVLVADTAALERVVAAVDDFFRPAVPVTGRRPVDRS